MVPGAEPDDLGVIGLFFSLSASAQRTKLKTPDVYKPANMGSQGNTIYCGRKFYTIREWYDLAAPALPCDLFQKSFSFRGLRRANFPPLFATGFFSLFCHFFTSFAVFVYSIPTGHIIIDNYASGLVGDRIVDHITTQAHS